MKLKCVFLSLSIAVLFGNLHAQKFDTVQINNHEYSIGEIKNGEKKGSWLVFDSLSTLIRRVTYLKDSTVYVEQYKYGTTIIKTTYEGYETKKKIILDGENKVFFNQGQQGSVIQNYSNGLLNGRQTWYNSMGRLKQNFSI